MFFVTNIGMIWVCGVPEFTICKLLPMQNVSSYQKDLLKWLKLWPKEKQSSMLRCASS